MPPVKTDSYQPVVALFSFIASCVVVQFFSLSAASPSLDQCTKKKKSNRNGAYTSVVLITGFGILARKTRLRTGVFLLGFFFVCLF